MRRFRFQFSLLTAVVMMLVAGGLLGLNMRKVYRLKADPNLPFVLGEPDATGNIFVNVDLSGEYTMGWPCAAYKCWENMDYFDMLETFRFGVGEWHYAGLAANILVALAMIIAAGVLCECLVRRHAPRPLP